MSNEVKTQTAQAPGSAATPEKKRGGRKLSAELGILLILVGIAALFEIAGWVFKGDTFLFNPQRLFIIVLQVSVVGLLAIAVTQVIITGGIDLSSGSVPGNFGNGGGKSGANLGKCPRGLPSAHQSSVYHSTPGRSLRWHACRVD